MSPANGMTAPSVNAPRPKSFRCKLLLRFEDSVRDFSWWASDATQYVQVLSLPLLAYP